MSDDVQWGLIHLSIGGLTLWFSHLFNRSARREQEKFDLIDKKQTFTVTQLKDHLYQMWQTSGNKERFMYPQEEFFVYGQIRSELDVLKSKTQPEQALIYQKLENYDDLMCREKDSDKVKTQQKYIFSNETQLPSFILQEDAQNKITVTDWSQTNRSLVKKYIGKIDKLIKYSASTLAAGACIKIGETQKELGITIGSHIVVYGKAVVDLKDFSIKFMFPSYLTSTKKEYLDIISGDVGLLKFLMVFFGIIGAFEIGNGIWSFFKSRNQRDRQQQQQLNPAPEPKAQDIYRANATK